MIIHNFEQGTPEWFKVRKGKMTASHATAIGNCGKGLDTYITELMAEFYSSGEKINFSNEDIERGHELEEQARSIYELNNDCKVEQVGFIEHNKFIGCSPDGLIGEDGGIEIKCLNDKNYFLHLIDEKQEIDSGHYWQVQMNLLITGRKWWDYVIYNPNYKNSIIVKRIYSDQIKFTALEAGFDVGIGKIRQIIDKMQKYL